MVEFQQRGDDLENNFAECKRLLEEAQGRLKELGEGRNEREEDEERKAELKKVQAEVRKLKKDEKSFEKMIEEQRREEKKLPWNVDTISKEGFSKVRHGIEVTSLDFSILVYLHLFFHFFFRVYSTSSLLQIRKQRRKRWRSIRPLWRSTQRKSNTLVCFCLDVTEYVCCFCLPAPSHFPFVSNAPPPCSVLYTQTMFSPTDSQFSVLLNRFISISSQCPKILKLFVQNTSHTYCS